MQEPPKGQPSWAARPLNIHDLLEAARENILGSSPSVPMSALSRSEVAFVNTIMERHYHVSMEREHTGYRFIRTCRQVPPVTPLAKTALRKAQEAMEHGASLEQALQVAHGYVAGKSGRDLQPLMPDLPLRIDEAAVAVADLENAKQTRTAGTERETGSQQQWTVHHLSIDPLAGLASVKIVDKLQDMYDDLPDQAWSRAPIHA